MAARTIWVHCPVEGCSEIRNEHGLTMHLRKKHGIGVPVASV